MGIVPTSESVSRWLSIPVLNAIPRRPNRMESSSETGSSMSIECVHVWCDRMGRKYMSKSGSIPERRASQAGRLTCNWRPVSLEMR